MNLQTLIKSSHAPDIELLGMAEHTADVEPGFLFLSSGHDSEVRRQHVRAAINFGAVAILCDENSHVQPPDSVPSIGIADLASRKGELAALFYGHPSATLNCIGVTGTNGKTSVAYHIADLYERVGSHCGYSGTLGWGMLDALNGADGSAGLTTANAVMLQRQLASFKSAGASAAALEISSHALAQERARDVELNVGIFTNLSRDHLDYHGTEAAYADAKRKLFTQWPLRTAVVNSDDEFGRSLMSECRMPVVTYGVGGDWSWQYEESGVGLEVVWQTPFGQFEATLPVLADFAVANITAAIVTLTEDGHAPRVLFEHVGQLRGIPGRMERISPSLEGVDSDTLPTVVVDYAHTPDALYKALAALRTFCVDSKRRLICVVGCGGDRDRGKRAIMGSVATKSADQAWFTSDNPRTENPHMIIKDMYEGVDAQQEKCVVECADRRAAILGSISQAGANDIVLIAGKGHESYQEIDGQRYPFDDRIESQLALNSYISQQREMH